MTTQAQTDLLPDLNITAADLAANREGQLGPQQHARLQRLQQRTLSVGAAVFFTLAFLATLLIFQGQQSASPLLSAGGVLITLINAIIVGTFARQYMRLGRDLRENAVEVLRGPLERVVQAGRRMNNYVLRIEGVEFAVKKDVFKRFTHEAPYALYRTRYARVLLAAEVDGA